MKYLACLSLILLGNISDAEDQWSRLGPDQGSHGSNVQQLIDSGNVQAPEKPVLVAVIDSGFDMDHEDLAGIWYTNTAEADGEDGVDDDRNGYIDDVHGWNFAGGSDGRQIIHARLELTRELKRLEDLATEQDLDAEQAAYLKELQAAFIKKRAEHARMGLQPFAMLCVWNAGVALAQKNAVDLNDTDAVAAMPVDGAEEWMAREGLLMLLQSGMRGPILRQRVEAGTRSMRTHFDKAFSESAVIGDDPQKMDDIGYGNNQLHETSGHGTAVTSLIAARTDNDIGLKGQCPTSCISILPVRAVPDGDERDKDVANALRYAVDQGAKIVNMSFGKYYSPNKAYVDAAFEYARKKGVLIIVGAGNEGLNISRKIPYPNAFPDNYQKHGYPQRFPNVIAVGASGNNEGRSLVPYWSNYSKERVLLFAPGAQVKCAAHGNTYELSDGTSLAAPVVSGVAALLWSQFPEKSLEDIVQALAGGARRYPDMQVRKPGTRRGVSTFAELCASGGIVDAWRSWHLLKHGTLPE